MRRHHSADVKSIKFCTMVGRLYIHCIYTFGRSLAVYHRPHMMWPKCDFRMQVWKVLQYRMQKFTICTPSHDFVGLYLHSWGIYQQLENKFDKQQYLFHMSSQYGELRPTNRWDRLAGLGQPSKFQRVSCLRFVTVLMSLNRGQPAKFLRFYQQHSTEGATYIWLGGRHVGHWPTFYFCYGRRTAVVAVFLFLFLVFFSSPNVSRHRLDVCHTCTHDVALVQI